MQIYVVNLFQGCTFPHSKCYSHNWKKARISFRMVPSCHLTYCPLKRAPLSLLSLPPKFCHNNQSLSSFCCPPPSPRVQPRELNHSCNNYTANLSSPLYGFVVYSLTVRNRIFNVSLSSRGALSSTTTSSLFP